MNLPQFKARTSELALPKEVDEKRDQVIKRCSTCQEHKPPPARYRASGMRAKNFGDLVFIDHLELRYRELVYAVFLDLDGATNLVWAKPQSTMSNEVALENMSMDG